MNDIWSLNSERSDQFRCAPRKPPCRRLADEDTEDATSDSQALGLNARSICRQFVKSSEAGIPDISPRFHWKPQDAGQRLKASGALESLLNSVRWTSSVAISNILARQLVVLSQMNDDTLMSSSNPVQSLWSVRHCPYPVCCSVYKAHRLGYRQYLIAES